MDLQHGDDNLQLGTKPPTILKRRKTEMKEDLQFAEKLPFPKKHIAIAILIITITILIAVRSNTPTGILKITDLNGNPINKIVLNSTEITLIVENQSNQPLEIIVEWQPKTINCTVYITNNPIKPKSSTVVKLESDGYCTITIKGEKI